MKVSVFRVEKPNGDGPYADDTDSEMFEHMNALHGDADHLDPADDSMLDGIYPDESCGFAMWNHLEEWFSGYEDILDAAGYSIVVYTVPLQYVRYGKNQALFLKEHAEQGRTLPLR